MGKYVYEFNRFGTLFRRNGMKITDALGRVIAGDEHWVWWWPANWIVIAIGLPAVGVVRLWKWTKSCATSWSRLVGYMTAAAAKADGFTHHGKYFGIPIWIGAVDSPAPMVATKWAPMEYLMTLFHHVEGTLRRWRYPDAPPVFQFGVGKAI